MLNKNIEKEKRKKRPIWNGYKPLVEETKKGRLIKAEKKHKNKGEELK